MNLEQDEDGVTPKELSWKQHHVLLMSRIVANSTACNEVENLFIECLDQWKVVSKETLYGLQVKKNIGFTSVANSDPAQPVVKIGMCACSTPIKNFNYVYNSLTMCSAVIGSECIKQFGKEKIKEFSKIKRESAMSRILDCQRSIGDFQTNLPCLTLNCLRRIYSGLFEEKLVAIKDKTKEELTQGIIQTLKRKRTQTLSLYVEKRVTKNSKRCNPFGPNYAPLYYNTDLDTVRLQQLKNIAIRLNLSETLRTMTKRSSLQSIIVASNMDRFSEQEYMWNKRFMFGSVGESVAQERWCGKRKRT